MSDFRSAGQGCMLVLQTMPPSEFFVAALVPQQVCVAPQVFVPLVPQSVLVACTQRPRPHLAVALHW